MAMVPMGKVTHMSMSRKEGAKKPKGMKRARICEVPTYFAVCPKCDATVDLGDNDRPRAVVCDENAAYSDECCTFWVSKRGRFDGAGE
jgi:hypothetical protein